MDMLYGILSGIILMCVLLGASEAYDKGWRLRKIMKAVGSYLGIFILFAIAAHFKMIPMIGMLFIAVTGGLLLLCLACIGKPDNYHDENGAYFD